mmetsp:Transcript_15518/g.48768  ORF Transcript_15518/g.48768 Transcript_15518/m.48768 type:complete len:229 (-) Transcript_15518:184-870(-)
MPERRHKSAAGQGGPSGIRASSRTSASWGTHRQAGVRRRRDHPARSCKEAQRRPLAGTRCAGRAGSRDCRGGARRVRRRGQQPRRLPGQRRRLGGLLRERRARGRRRGLLLRPGPAPAPGRLVLLSDHHGARGSGGGRGAGAGALPAEGQGRPAKCTATWGLPGGTFACLAGRLRAGVHRAAAAPAAPSVALAGGLGGCRARSLGAGGLHTRRGPGRISRARPLAARS